MSCSVYDQPDKSFAPTSANCSHLRLGVSGNGVPQTKSSYGPKSNVHPQDQPYLLFSQPRATESLNLRHEHPDDVSVFPRNIYDKNPFAGSVSYNIQPRDRSTHYTYSPDPNDKKERSEHTLWQSRYGYDRFPNEYGVGVQSRGYIEPPECNACYVDIPKDMAPARFYSDKHLSTNTSEFRDVID